VKLIDFGLAKILRDPRRGAGPAPLAKPTDEGVMLGTPRYFAPEQSRGELTSASADLYSAGVVLYKMLAGHDPFQHCTNVYDLVVAHLSEAPRPPSESAPNFIPGVLDAAVLKALAKHPADRHADARAFRAAIATPLHATPLRRWQSTERLDGPVPMVHAAIPAHVPKPAASTFAYDLEDGQTVAIVRPRPRPSRGGSRYAAAAIGAVLGMGAAVVFMRTEIASLASPADPGPSASAAEPGAAQAPASQGSAATDSASAEPRPSATPATTPPRPSHQAGARGVTPGAASAPPAPHRLFGTDP
jgi:hypothetical protein